MLFPYPDALALCLYLPMPEHPPAGVSQSPESLESLFPWCSPQHIVTDPETQYFQQPKVLDRFPAKDIHAWSSVSHWMQQMARSQHTAFGGRCSTNVVTRRFQIQLSKGTELYHNIYKQLQLQLCNTSQYSEAVPGGSPRCYTPSLIAFCQAALWDKITVEWLNVCLWRKALFYRLTAV